MNEPPAAPLRFIGVTADQLGGDPSVGAIVTIDYAGTTYRARVIARNVDYDDFGTEVIRFILEATAG